MAVIIWGNAKIVIIISKLPITPASQAKRGGQILNYYHKLLCQEKPKIFMSVQTATPNFPNGVGVV